MKNFLYISKQEAMSLAIQEATAGDIRTITATCDDWHRKLVQQPRMDLVLVNCERNLDQVLNLCRAIKDNQNWAHLPIIVMLPHNYASRRLELIQAGADEYVFKPLQPIELTAKVNTFLRIRDTYEELERKNAELLNLGSQCEELLKLKKDLIYMASHDLKVPVTNIGSFTKLLLNEKLGALNPQQKRSLQTIEKNSESMLQLIESLLDFFEINEKLTIHKQPLDVSKLLANIYHRSYFWAVDKGQELSLNIPLEAITFSTDKLRLTQAVENVLHNAFKYTQRGGLVELGAYLNQSPPELVIYVKDTGLGITAQQQQKIFERFIKNHNYGTEGEFGLGLGLTVAEKIVNALGGEITLESEPQKGSTFYLKLKGEIS